METTTDVAPPRALESLSVLHVEETATTADAFPLSSLRREGNDSSDSTALLCVGLQRFAVRTVRQSQQLVRSLSIEGCHPAGCYSELYSPRVRIRSSAHDFYMRG